MNLKPFVFNSFGVNGFVLSNDAGDAILIDPSVSDEQEGVFFVSFGLHAILAGDSFADI